MKGGRKGKKKHPTLNIIHETQFSLLHCTRFSVLWPDFSRPMSCPKPSFPSALLARPEVGCWCIEDHSGVPHSCAFSQLLFLPVSTLPLVPAEALPVLSCTILSCYVWLQESSALFFFLCLFGGSGPVLLRDRIPLLHLFFYGWMLLSIGHALEISSEF